MTLRVGVVGVGWGAHVQVPAFRAAAGFEPVALCARTPQRLQRVATKLDIADTSTGWRTFVARDDLDVISVATPTARHHDMTLAALEAGKAVLCEKPLATDTAAARGMVLAARKSGRPTTCCFENRWNADWLAVAEQVRAGFLGRPYVARVTRSAPYWHPSHPPQARWMYERDQGGGYLAGMLVHDLDFLCSLLGRPESVCAEVRTSEPVRDLPDGETLHVTADDTAALLMRMESGVTAMLSVSVMGAHADHYRLELFGADGTIVGDGNLRSATYQIGAAGDEGLSTLPVRDRDPAHPERLPAGLAGHASRAMALMLEDWLPAFDGGQSSAPTFDDGLLSIAVIDAAHRSAEGGGWEPVDASV
ncbi:Gfo/Idh/MocA family protein [Mycobacterium branderi]|uniref:Oxidoreductase n=1 Tax=Mycobacterium branderi TaxID=43348 RepID=A0A7I7WFU8_9MYCO|nr:Gfo/Idh/MocA family oxidoreductase [Mycobacterium branderi]MCV7231666.1 Gfo/Idh/MocA family oxidoreductase [Mycobacterium branderi]ORA40355.1 oxidoreductase [Mycobacterium branderi]BBZ14848.1 oxidoreductase [Mycobacterium branderi]